MVVIYGWLPCVALATGWQFVRHYSLRASGGMSGPWPRKVVVLVECAGRDGAAASRSGGFKCSTTLRVLDLVSCGR
jgi:hypothetical protein